MRIRIEFGREEKEALVKGIEEAILDCEKPNPEDLEDKVGTIEQKFGKVEYNSNEFIDIELVPAFSLACVNIIAKYFDVVKVLTKMITELVEEWFVDKEETISEEVE